MMPAPDRPRILVVEDEMLVAHDPLVHLVLPGFEPICNTTSGKEAPLLAEPLQPDLVLMNTQFTNANPARTKLRLSERMLVHEVPTVIAKMKQIKALVVSFSLDDFGTDYSSRSYLKLLPIDQSFGRDLLTA